ncbi:hypothetical protein BJX65DRAFT_304083 [Aspergillus insuetus]
MCPMVFCLAANIIAVATLSTAARYVAMMLMPCSFYAAATVVISWAAISLSQPTIKRASAIALINVLCNTPNGLHPSTPLPPHRPGHLTHTLTLFSNGGNSLVLILVRLIASISPSLPRKPSSVGTGTLGCKRYAHVPEKRKP